jgi:AcrR family transcriptional regulator
MSSVNVPTKPTLEPDTRQRILDVAAKLFAERGYAGTSVRDIAKELGIANPSIYHHFKSKADVLVELLSAPLQSVEIAVREAKQLSGEARARRIIQGFLESLEVRHGVAFTALPDEKVLESHRRIAFEMRQYIADLLGESTAPDHRDLRITMAMGAVQGVVASLTNADTFVEDLRRQREVIIDLILKILR